MKTQNKVVNKHEGNSDHKQEIIEAAEFHAKRIRRETKIEAKKESPDQPHGTDEYEQLIAEDAGFNTKPMIEQAAFFIAEQRDSAAGSELSDWLQAEAAVEDSLRSTAIERRKNAGKDRRKATSPK